MSKEKRNEYIEHKDKDRGSIRVWASDKFYDMHAQIKHVEITDGKVKPFTVSPGCFKKPFEEMCDRYHIDHQAGQHEGKKLLEKSPDGLDFDSIRTIKNDDHLRIYYSAWGEDILADILCNALEWLKDNKISYGEPDGALVCLKGKCIGLKDLNKMRKKSRE